MSLSNRIATILALVLVAGCGDVPTATPPEGPSASATTASTLSVTIDGPWWVSEGPYYEWTAYPSGGNGSYTYQWEISDVLGRTWIAGDQQTFGTTFDCRWVNFVLTVYVTSGSEMAMSEMFIEGLGDGQCE